MQCVVRGATTSDPKGADMLTSTLWFLGAIFTKLGDKALTREQHVKRYNFGGDAWTDKQ